MPASPLPKLRSVPQRVSKLASPPPHLHEVEAALFRRMISEFQIDDSNSIELLVVACEAHQRGRIARELIDAEGAIIRDRWGVARAHPAVTIERDSRDAYLRAVRALNLRPVKSKEPATW